MADEVKPRSESRNFFVSIVTLIFLSFELSGAPIELDPGAALDVVLSKDVGAIIAMLFVNLLNPAMKIAGKIQRGELKADFLRSPNFITQALTVILSGVALAGIVFPEAAPGEIVLAIQSKDFVAIWIALGVNIINPIYHFIKKQKPAGTLTAAA